MKSILKVIVAVITGAVLFGCGGGGGGGGSAATKATTKMNLFGNITSAGKIVATVDTTIAIPSGVFVNYTAAPGLTAGTFPIRKGVVVPTGTILLPTDGISGTYTISNGPYGGGTLHVLLNNMPGQGQAQLKSKGEIATINFSLQTPGVLPASMPVAPLTTEVWEDFNHTNIGPKAGNTLTLVTTYQ